MVLLEKVLISKAVVSMLVSINEVALHRVRLLLGWVTICW